MINRRIAALAGVVAIAAAACSPAASTAPARPRAVPSAPASAPAVPPPTTASSASLEQLPAAALGGQGPAQHAEGRDDGGGMFIDFDANLSNTQQLTDVQTLINQGAKVIVLLAQDDKAGAEVVKLAAEDGIPVIAYDRLIEDPTSSTCRSTTRTSARPRRRRCWRRCRPAPRQARQLRPHQGRPGRRRMPRPSCPPAGIRPASRPPSMPAHQDPGRPVHGRLGYDQGPEQHGSDHRRRQRGG